MAIKETLGIFSDAFTVNLHQLKLFINSYCRCPSNSRFIHSIYSIFVYTFLVFANPHSKALYIYVKVYTPIFINITTSKIDSDSLSFFPPFFNLRLFFYFFIFLFFHFHRFLLTILHILPIPSVAGIDSTI